VCCNELRSFIPKGVIPSWEDLPAFLYVVRITLLCLDFIIDAGIWGFSFHKHTLLRTSAFWNDSANGNGWVLKNVRDRKKNAKKKSWLCRYGDQQVKSTSWLCRHGDQQANRFYDFCLVCFFRQLFRVFSPPLTSWTGDLQMPRTSPPDGDKPKTTYTQNHFANSAYSLKASTGKRFKNLTSSCGITFSLARPPFHITINHTGQAFIKLFNVGNRYGTFSSHHVGHV